MARAATTSDAFNAIAEPQRRDILDLLRGGNRPVLELVGELGIAQPTVSEHMRVLARARLVRGRKIKQWTFYKRDESRIRELKRIIVKAI